MRPEIAALVEALDGAKYTARNGATWTFAYEYPGYFAWYRIDVNGKVYSAMYATPDHDNEGEIQIECDRNLDGGSFVESVARIAYTEPLTREAYVALIVPILDRESEVSL